MTDSGADTVAAIDPDVFAGDSGDQVGLAVRHVGGIDEK
ncbi:unnamed protein product, partial [marine sediment metagenome]